KRAIDRQEISEKAWGIVPGFTFFKGFCFVHGSSPFLALCQQRTAIKTLFHDSPARYGLSDSGYGGHASRHGGCWGPNRFAVSSHSKCGVPALSGRVGIAKSERGQVWRRIDSGNKWDSRASVPRP